MSDLQHKDIKSINVDISIDYKGHKISYYREGKTFILQISDDDGDKSDIHIIKDQVFDDCILDLLNIVLKPYIKKFIDDYENN